LTGTYTRLHEGSGLLGIQSLDPADFRSGTTTDGYSLGLNWAVSPKLSVMATGTLAKTRQTEGGQTLAVDGSGLTASAFEVGVRRTSLFRAGDRMQVSLSQPMYVEHGALNVTGVQVVDRQTGELGIVTQRVEIAGQRRLAGEALYAVPVQRGEGDVSLFGRTETASDVSHGQVYMAGARYRLRF
jgi:hypothetical protein